jgi:hypothetical protein
MERSLVLRSRPALIVGAVLLAAAIAACAEQTEGGAACPLLCPAQNVSVLDTVLEPIVLDSSVAGYPLRGTEPLLMLARRGDTLDTRPVIRFDSLLKFFTKAGGDSSIEHVDSAYVKLRIDRPNSIVTAPVTIEVFDVDTTVGDSAAAANDTATAVERLLFRPDRLIGTATLDTNQLGDSIRVPLDSATIETKVLDKLRLRVGLRISSAQPVVLQIVSREGADGPVLRYDPNPADTAIKHLSVFPQSRTPQLHPIIASDLADYVHIFSAPGPAPPPLLTVGGLPGRRVYMRFDVPARIIDSSNVLRASLVLTQAPLRGLDDSTAFYVHPHLVTAGLEVTDVGRSAYLLNATGAGFDSIAFVPRDSGLKTVEIVNALRGWAFTSAVRGQRAVVLRASREGLQTAQAAFFSSRAAAGLRPRLRISYSPLTNFGIP